MDINPSLSKLADSTPEGRIRLFACDCCSRLIPVFPDLDLEKLILFGQNRSSGKTDQDSLLSLRNHFGKIYNSLYPGYGDPSPKTLALSSAGEVAFTDSSLDAAINALEFSADAIAKKAAYNATDTEYDRVYDDAYALERGAQSGMLHRFFGV